MLKKLNLLILVGIIIGTIMGFQTSAGFDESDLFTVIQDPDGSSLLINTPLNLTIINNLDIDISSVLLHYCSLEPTFICHFPSLQVNKSFNDLYNVYFTPEYGVGTVLGYNFEINLINGSTYNIPNSLSYSDTKTIREASDNLFYFLVNIVGEIPSVSTSEISSQVNGYSILIVLALILPVLIKRRE